MRDLAPRQAEAVRLYVTGLSAAEAARGAGYAPAYARRAASHLFTKPHVRAAVDAARTALVEKTKYDLHAAVAEIDDKIVKAEAAKQFNAVANLLKLKAQLHGLLIEKMHHVHDTIDLRAALADAKARIIEMKPALAEPPPQAPALAAPVEPFFSED